MLDQVALFFSFTVTIGALFFWRSRSRGRLTIQMARQHPNWMESHYSLIPKQKKDGPLIPEGTEPWGRIRIGHFCSNTNIKLTQMLPNIFELHQKVINLEEIRLLNFPAPP